MVRCVITQSYLNISLIHGVKGRSRRIETEQHRSTFQQSTRDRKALLLDKGQMGASRADLGLVIV